MSKIHVLSVENFKRARAVTIEFPPDGTLEICGANSVGKSSCVDAVWAAIGGGRASPKVPIRDGARKGSVVLDLGDMKVKRDWGPSGTTLTVTDADGCKVGRPQEMLDKLWARFAVDPLEFTRMEPAKQAALLRKVAGLDLADLDRRRTDLLEERKEAARAVAVQEARAADYSDATPAEEVSAAELMRKLKDAEAHNDKVVSARERAKALYDDVGSLAGKYLDKLAELERVRQDLVDLELDLEKARAAREEILGSIGEEIDTATAVRAIEEIEATNARSRRYRERVAAEDHLRQIRGQYEEADMEIGRIDDERKRRLAEATMPVEGLSLDDADGITYRGVPLAQASTSEQIRCGLAMAAALKPELRLIVIKDGSLLDPENLRGVDAWAREHGWQVLVERVADDTIGAGVVIEEGVVKSSKGVRAGRTPAAPLAGDAPAARAMERDLFGDDTGGSNNGDA